MLDVSSTSAVVAVLALYRRVGRRCRRRVQGETRVFVLCRGDDRSDVSELDEKASPHLVLGENVLVADNQQHRCRARDGSVEPGGV